MWTGISLLLAVPDGLPNQAVWHSLASPNTFDGGRGVTVKLARLESSKLDLKFIQNTIWQHQKCFQTAYGKSLSVRLAHLVTWSRRHVSILAHAADSAVFVAPGISATQRTAADLCFMIQSLSGLSYPVICLSACFRDIWERPAGGGHILR